MAIQKAFESLAKDKEIIGKPLSILMYMFSKLAWENFICIQQKEICEQLKIDKSDVSRSIKLLLIKGIILQGPKLGRTSSYRLNANYGWKGKIKNISEARNEQKAKLKLVENKF